MLRTWLERLSIGQRLYTLVGCGTSAVVGLTALCAYTAHEMHAAAVASPPLDRAALDAMRAHLITMAITISVVSLALVLPFFWLVIQSIVSRIREAQVALRHVARGDLTQAVPSAGGDEVGELLRTIIEMQTALSDVINRVRGNSASMREAVTEIAAGNDDLSRRTEVQAASLQLTTANLESMTQGLAATVVSTERANELASQSLELTREGSDAVQRFVSRMRGINEQSTRIAEIVSVIDAVAFQTNILALNASVESARAGEHGKGFAVVAGEVRMLARRCSDAAKEIRALIANSGTEIQRGVKEADFAAAAIGKVSESVQDAAELVRAVTESTKTQAAGVGQVKMQLDRIDAATQQNAALVEQAAAAAASVRHRAGALVDSVLAFRVTP